MIQHLRITGISVVATLAVVCSPIAQAENDTVAGAPSVCNLASNSPVHQGDLVALDAPTGSAAEKFRKARGAHPGQGKGLVNAAANSPALSACGPLTETPPTGGGSGTSGGTDTGGGDTGGDGTGGYN